MILSPAPLADMEDVQLCFRYRVHGNAQNRPAVEVYKYDAHSRTENARNGFSSAGRVAAYHTHLQLKPERHSKFSFIHRTIILFG